MMARSSSGKWQAATWPGWCGRELAARASAHSRELRARAPGVEPAARRRVDRRGHVALQDDPPLLLGHVRVRDRHRRQQGARVGVLRVLVQRVARGHLDDLAQVHDRHAVGHVLHHRQVVRDEQVGQVELRPGGPRAGSGSAPGSTRRAPTPARRTRSASAAAPAPGRRRCAGAGRPRTRAGTGCSARGSGPPAP